MKSQNMICETPILHGGNIQGNQLYIKREDTIPFSFGGNKVRIAQEYFMDMMQKRNDCIIGYGNTRSNLCRVLSNLSTSMNIPCYIISPNDDDDTRTVTNNSKLVELCGANVYMCNKTDVAKTVESVIQICKKKGLSPYYIYGSMYGKGNESVPVRAYAKVYQEICRQEQRMNLKFDYIFLATGTGMTQAGLVSGAELNGDLRNIVGISVARKSAQAYVAIQDFLKAYLNERNTTSEIKNTITICDEYLCDGYGKYNPAILKTILNNYRMRGIPMDTTYVGKGFYGMEEYIKKMKIIGKNILFIHTGGTPLYFDILNKLE